MREIRLSNGMTAKVDDEVYDWASHYRWHAMRSGNQHYAGRWARVNGKSSLRLMHREILNVRGPMQVDHADTDTLNNQFANLRTCTASQNRANTRKANRGLAPYKGVFYYKKLRRYRSCLVVDGKQIHLGYFDDPAEAARVYDAAAVEHFGRFARPNFLQEGTSR